MEPIKEYISKVKTEKPNNCVKVFFSRRNTTNGASKYVSYQPSVSSVVQMNIIDTIIPYIDNQLDSNQIVEYNPVGVIDGALEKLSLKEIPMFVSFKESLQPDAVFRDMSSLKIEKIDFYCIKIAYSGKEILLFRQFQKLRKLRSGILTRIVDNELNVIERDFLGIDEFTDIIAFEENLYLLNHISLERIFNYRDEFLRKTKEALGEILSKGVLSNIDQFTSDCCNDIRIMKRFTSIMTKDRLPMFFDNYDRVPEIVKELGLDIEFDDCGRIIYRERSQLFHIVNLLSDSYFKSLLANRRGIAMVEGEV